MFWQEQKICEEERAKGNCVETSKPNGKKLNSQWFLHESTSYSVRTARLNGTLNICRTRVVTEYNNNYTHDHLKTKTKNKSKKKKNRSK